MPSFDPRTIIWVPNPHPATSLTQIFAPAASLSSVGLPSPIVLPGSADLVNGRTVDFNFVFKDKQTNLQVALWAHQSRLCKFGNFARMFGIPKPADVSGTSGRRYQITGGITMDATFTSRDGLLRSIFAHCMLLRFMYTGRLCRDFHLDEFFFTAPEPPTGASVNCDAFARELMLIPLRSAPWEDIRGLATVYEMWDAVNECTIRLQAGA
ncbi:hypothetical protein CPC16_006172 [Podila verticillata]|nr:hypothetical protein CPC16_006172 [Podila verticillata]KAI9236340.1 MAG: hypothetical protein BYD32DRAFT_468737 [Podila humilis]